MEKNGIWEEEWKVAAFMVDTNQRIRLKSLADILQELANNHANHRKCGFEVMKESGKFWVLNRQAIQILHWPKWEQQLRVESWISMMKGPFSLRHFAVYDDQNNILVKASYLWTSIDRIKMKPTAIPDGDFPIVASRDFALPEPQKIKITGEIIQSVDYIVRDSDLDIIGHTNNAIYLEWASNILRSKHNLDYQIVEANYTGESFVDQSVQIRLLEKEGRTLSIEVLNSGGQIIFKSKFSEDIP